MYHNNGLPQLLMRRGFGDKKAHNQLERRFRVGIFVVGDTAFIVRDEKVFVCRYDDFSPLRLDSAVTHNVPTEIHFFRDKGPVESVAVGDKFAIFLMSDGRVFSYRCKTYTQVGLSNEISLDNPTEIAFFSDKGPVESVAVGAEFAIFLMRDGRVFGCGCNRRGQLGLGGNIDRDVPTEIDFFRDKDPVKSVAAGAESTIFLMRDGRAFGCGCNRHGQLGLGGNRDRDVPTEIDFFRDKGPVESVAAGAESTIFLMRDGRVFGCGCNRRGQLGLGDNRDRDVPTEIDFLGDKGLVESVAVGSKYTVFLMSDGRALGCGKNKDNLMGLGNNMVPTEIDFLRDQGLVAAVVAAVYDLSFYFLMRDENVIRTMRPPSRYEYLGRPIYAELT